MNFTGLSVAGCQQGLTSKVTTYGHGLCQMSSAVAKVLKKCVDLINIDVFLYCF